MPEPMTMASKRSSSRNRLYDVPIECIAASIMSVHRQRDPEDVDDHVVARIEEHEVARHESIFHLFRQRRQRRHELCACSVRPRNTYKARLYVSDFTYKGSRLAARKHKCA